MAEGTIVEKNTHASGWCSRAPVYSSHPPGQEWPAQRHRCVDPCLYEAYMPFSRVIGIEGSFAVNRLVLRYLDIWCSHSLILNKIFMVISEMRSLRIRSFIAKTEWFPVDWPRLRLFWYDQGERWRLLSVHVGFIAHNHALHLSYILTL